MMIPVFGLGIDVLYRLSKEASVGSEPLSDDTIHAALVAIRELQYPQYP